MGAFYLSLNSTGQSPQKQQALKTLKQQGFRHITDFSCEDFTFFYARKINLDSDSVFRENPQNFCVTTGTLIYRQQRGDTAAQKLFHDFKNSQLDTDQIYGNFALVFCIDGNFTIYSDSQGIYNIWHDTGLQNISSSFLALANNIDTPTINPQAVYEHVFQEATFGGDTVFREIQRLKVKKAIQIKQKASFIQGLEVSTETPAADSIEPYLQRSHDQLKQQFQAIKTCFADDIDSALSGGYDSRLLLGLCLEQGITPHLHVYGKPDSADVVVAKNICEQENIPLVHQDKSGTPPVSPEEFQTIVSENYHAFQGHCADGILDNGNDLRTRLQRTENGRLLLNGGGGEVFRNFFYLPDRTYSVRELLWSFYNRFDPAVCTPQFNEKRYYQKLAEKTAECVYPQVPAPDNALDLKLSRTQTEYLYAGFRCTYWMGQNNSLNNQFGWFLTPYVDEQISRTAGKIPIAMKNYGLFQGKLIEKVSPALAGYRSDYGYSFTEAVNWKRKLKAQTTLLRPPWLRRYIYRLKKQHREHWSYFLATDYIDKILPRGFNYLGNFFNLDNITDEQQFKRICTLEYLFQSCNAAMPADGMKT